MMFDFLRTLMNKSSKRNTDGKKKIAPRTTEKGLHEEQFVRFESLIVMDKTPPNDLVEEGKFIVVIYKEKHHWALFRCPCGCGHVISLSLQKIHRPNWSAKKSKNGRPTLYPSVWQNQGCLSHFWIEDGVVFWCRSTGKSPNSSDYY